MLAQIKSVPSWYSHPSEWQVQRHRRTSVHLTFNTRIAVPGKIIPFLVSRTAHHMFITASTNFTLFRYIWEKAVKCPKTVPTAEKWRNIFVGKKEKKLTHAWWQHNKRHKSGNRLSNGLANPELILVLGKKTKKRFIWRH